MSFPSIPYTFENGSGHYIDATQSNAVFSALSDALTDGSKDLYISSLTDDSRITCQANLAISNNLVVTAGNIGINTTSPQGAIDSSNLYVTGDIYTSPVGGGWTDYSGLITVEGWNPVSVYSLDSRKVGNIRYVGWYLSGTSDATYKYFTLPEAADQATSYSGPCQVDTAVDETVSGRWYIPAGDNTCYLYRDWGDATWISSGAAICGGILSYRVA